MKKKQQYNVSIDIELAELIQEEQEKTRVSKSLIVNDILKAYFLERENEAD